MHQKVSNKLMVSPTCKKLNEWAHTGNLKARLKSFRCLDTSDKEMCFLLVEALVIISRGRSKAYPFGEPANVSTKAFKKLPSGPFGLVLSAMYPYIKHDQSAWKEMNKKDSKATHTMLGLWSLNKMNRYGHPHPPCHPTPTPNRSSPHIRNDTFINGLRTKRELLFEIYEREGGKYHGPDAEDTTSPSRARKRRAALDPNDDIFEEQEDSDDEDFA